MVLRNFNTKICYICREFRPTPVKLLICKFLNRIRQPLLYVLLIFPMATMAQGLTPHQKDSLLNNVQLIPGTTIKIIPPAYFEPFESDGKYGFMHKGAGASISVQEVKNTPYTLVVAGFTKEYIEGQGLKYISKEEVKTKAGKDATIIAVSFMAKSADGSQEVEYERLMLFTGDAGRTIWVQGNYPVMVKKVLYLVIRESLLSVQF